MCLKATEYEILDYARIRPQVTRPELAENLRMSLPTVSLTVNRLLKRGLMVHVGRLESTGGRRADILKIHPDYLHAIGIHVNSWQVYGVLANVGGELIHGARRAWKNGTPASERIEDILAVCAELKTLAKRPERSLQIEGVGIGISGQIDHETGISITLPHVPDWSSVPLASIISERLGLATELYADVSTRTRAELRFGAARHVKNFLYCFGGGYLRLGIVADGALVRGSSGNAGEFGHISVPPNNESGPLFLEDVACPRAIRDTAIANGWTDPDPNNFERCPELSNLFRAAAAGETGAREAVALAARHVGHALADIASIFEPQMIVLAGAYYDAPDLFVESIQEQLGRRYMAAQKLPIGIIRSQGIDYACAIGAANLYFETHVPLML